MARVVWTDEAESWLRDIYDYIASDNPSAAAATVEGIYVKAQGLADFPEMARVTGHRPGMYLYCCMDTFASRTW